MNICACTCWEHKIIFWIPFKLIVFFISPNMYSALHFIFLEIYTFWIHLPFLWKFFFFSQYKIMMHNRYLVTSKLQAHMHLISWVTHWTRSAVMHLKQHTGIAHHSVLAHSSSGWQSKSSLHERTKQHWWVWSSVCMKKCCSSTNGNIRKGDVYAMSLHTCGAFFKLPTK